MLEHHADFSTDPVEVRLRLNLLAIHPDFARGSFLQVVDTAQHGRLAGTRRADHNDHLFRSHGQVDAVEDLDITIPLVKVLNLNHGFIIVHLF